MGKFRNQKKNLSRNKVAISIPKLRQMRKEAAKKKNVQQTVDGDVEMTEEVVRVPGLSVKSAKKLAEGKLENVPKINDKKIIRKTDLPIHENKKIVDAPTGRKGVTPQYITKKKAKKLYKHMTHRARETFAQLKKEMAENGEQMES